MTHVTNQPATVTARVRFFAAARDAAGAQTAVLTLPAGSTADDLARELCGQSEQLRLVIRKCTFLIDGVAVRDWATVLRADQTIDVLPPFAGG